MRYNDFTTIVDFLGNNMTDEQATQLMDLAKHELGRDEIFSLGNYSAWNYQTPLHTLVSEYKGECGIFN
jgi:hypothetical protein